MRMKFFQTHPIALSVALSILCASSSIGAFSFRLYDPCWTVPENKRSEFKRYFDDIERLTGEGDNDGALRICNVALTSFTDNEAVLRKRAAIFAARKQYSKAIVDYDHAIEQFSTPLSALLDRAKVKELAGLRDDALADYDAFLAREPTSGVCFSKAKLLGDLGRKEEGRRALLDGLYLTNYETDSFWKQRKSIDLTKCELFQTALLALKIRDIALPDDLRLEKASQLFDDVEALVKLAPTSFVDLKFLGTRTLKSKIQNGHRAVVGAPTEHWSSISWNETPHRITLQLIPNPLFASMTAGAVRARFGEERKDVGQIACGPTHLQYKQKIEDSSSTESSWALGKADGNMVSSVQIVWTTEAGKQNIARMKRERLLRDQERGSQSAKMIACLKKIDQTGKVISKSDLETLLSMTLYRSSQSFSPQWTNRNENESPVRELEFNVRFEPESVMGDGNLVIEPSCEKFMLAQSDFEQAFGKGTAPGSKTKERGSRVFEYPRPYGSLSVLYQPPNYIPGREDAEVKTARGVVKACDVVHSVSFWWQQPKQAATALQYSESVSWRDMLNRARNFMEAKDLQRAEALLHAAFEKQESLEPNDDKARHKRIEELKAALTEFFRESEKPQVVAYLERSSCIQFEEDLRKQMCGPMYTFPTIEEDQTKPWHVTIRKLGVAIERKGIGRETLPATAPEFKRLLNMFGYCDKEVPDLPPDIVDAFYYK